MIRLDLHRLARAYQLQHGCDYATASRIVSDLGDRAAKMADRDRGNTLRITTSHRATPRAASQLRPAAPATPSTTAPPAIGLRSLSLQIARERHVSLEVAQRAAEEILNRQRARLPPTPHAGPPRVSLRDLAHQIAAQEGCTMGAAQLKAEEIIERQKERA